MAFEATKVELTNETGFPRSYTCASGTAITKGSLLNLSDPRTAAQSATEGEPLAGIASMDKSATDQSTRITAWTDGVFEMYASGAIVAGRPVMSAGSTGTNHVKLAPTTASGAAILGYAEETAADDEVINVRVRL